MDGSLPILDDDLKGVAIPHRAAARMLLDQGREVRRTDRNGILVMPLLIAINGLRDQGCDDVVGRLEEVRQERLAIGAQTALQIGCGTLDASRDLDVPRLGDAGPDRVQDGRDDPVLASLLDMHGVKHLARVAAGLDARWRMHARSAHPYVDYAGLPAGMPPFILRPHSTARASLVEISFGQGVTYSNLGAYRMIQVERPLPATIAAGLEGRRVTDAIAHPAFVDLVFGAPADHGGPGMHIVDIAKEEPPCAR